MNDLLEHIKKRILTEGPLSVADYMSEALANPKYGYYMNGDPFGKAGDFITAPEISQMFGELIGIWCAATWGQMGAPEKIKLIEVGPGRGTLMVDLLHALQIAPDFLATIEIHMIETSPDLEKHQKRNLRALDKNIKWHKNFTEVPAGPFILFANELLDALPIQQFERSSSGWIERKVACDVNGNLMWLLDGQIIAAQNFIPVTLKDCAVGSIFELSTVAANLVTSIAQSILEYGGTALFIDYGYVKSATGDTLQAIKGHKFHDVLKDPGNVDLSAHVDFEYLGKQAKATGILSYDVISQRNFLRMLGIEHRANQLKRVASIRQQSDIITGLNRLIGADEMGSLFKAFVLAHPDQPVPEGFRRK
jgi:NADH dehydrogenase [ubiquinone] 1 alpha subcomplex assembly factor 7